MGTPIRYILPVFSDHQAPFSPYRHQHEPLRLNSDPRLEESSNGDSGLPDPKGFAPLALLLLYYPDTLQSSDYDDPKPSSASAQMW